MSATLMKEVTKAAGRSAFRLASLRASFSQGASRLRPVSHDVAQRLAQFNQRVKLVPHSESMRASLAAISQIPIPDYIRGPRHLQTMRYLVHERTRPLLSKMSKSASWVPASVEEDPYAAYVKQMVQHLPDLSPDKTYVVTVRHSVRIGVPKTGNRIEEKYHRDDVDRATKKAPLMLVSWVAGNPLPTTFRLGQSKGDEVSLVATDSESVAFYQDIKVDDGEVLIYHKGQTPDPDEKRNILVVSVQESSSVELDTK